MARGRRDDEGDRSDRGDDGFSADDFPGREILSGGDPMVILKRLHQENALELWPRCAEHISEQSFLLQPDRLYLRLVARLAYAAPTYRGKPPLGAWISERLEVSLREVLSDDRDQERRELPSGLEHDPRYVFLSKTLGIEIGLAPRVCNRLNSLPRDQRAVFFGVLVRERGIQGHARDAGLDPEVVRASLKRILRDIGIRRHIDLQGFEWGKGSLPEVGDDG